MRVIVCGSRSLYSYEHRQWIADRLFDLPGDSVIVHGAARGADRIAHQEAEKLGLLVEPHPPGYDESGVSAKRAPLLRNQRMAMMGADLCIAFWDGKSSGTAHMIGEARAAGIPVETLKWPAAVPPEEKQP